MRIHDPGDADGQSLFRFPEPLRFSDSDGAVGVAFKDRLEAWSDRTVQPASVPDRPGEPKGRIDEMSHHVEWLDPLNEPEVRSGPIINLPIAQVRNAAH